VFKDEGDEADVGERTAGRLTDRGDFEQVEQESTQQDASVLVNDGVCPWCSPDDRYEGENVGMHASRAHPDEWADYQEDST